jgi:hypothetical protein
LGGISSVVPVLRELILREDTPLDGTVKQFILCPLDSAHGRCAVWHGISPTGAGGGGMEGG